MVCYKVCVVGLFRETSVRRQVVLLDNVLQALDMPLSQILFCRREGQLLVSP